MTEEFNLSKKMIEMYASKEGSVVKGFDACFEEDVKEFIKRISQRSITWIEAGRYDEFMKMRKVRTRRKNEFSI